jgi:hypothetical protein
MMASRPHRLHHWLWHQIRNSWLRYPPETQEEIRALGWETPRPALTAQGRPVLDNNAGEDFLYMHRQMLVDVSRILARVGDPAYPRIIIWSVPPPPGDETFPVPASWFDPAFPDELGRRTFHETIQRLKSDIFYQKRMLGWQRLFTDSAWLRQVTLGELGTLIEQSMHAAMHNRWAEAPASARPEPDPTKGGTIDALWDDPRYDYLGDTYSSHVHPVFWSLHGWVDDRIEDWKAANGVYGQAFWQGTWVGKMPEVDVAADEEVEAAGVEVSLTPGGDGALGTVAVGERMAVAGPHALMEHPHHGGHHGDELEELVGIVARCGVFHPGYIRPLLPATD